MLFDLWLPSVSASITLKLAQGKSVKCTSSKVITHSSIIQTHTESIEKSKL